jgi:2-keto-4-pentenoate hydratase
VECEFAVRFRRYAPITPTLTGNQEYEAAFQSVEAIIPAIEIASTRWQTAVQNSAPLAIADLGTSASTSRGISFWRSRSDDRVLYD